MIRIVIDGYNVIFNREEFSDVVENSGLEEARKALCSHIAGLSQADKTIVVFDGDAGVNLSSRTRICSIQALFSSSQLSADDEIESMVRTHKNPNAVTVVTSDMALASRIKALKAKTVRVEEFFEVRSKSERTEPSEPRVKFDGPGPAELKYWMGVFGCEDEE